MKFYLLLRYLNERSYSTTNELRLGDKYTKIEQMKKKEKNTQPQMRMRMNKNEVGILNFTTKPSTKKYVRRVHDELKSTLIDVNARLIARLSHSSHGKYIVKKKKTRTYAGRKTAERHRVNRFFFFKPVVMMVWSFRCVFPQHLIHDRFRKLPCCFYALPHFPSFVVVFTLVLNKSFRSPSGSLVCVTLHMIRYKY